MVSYPSAVRLVSFLSLSTFSKPGLALGHAHPNVEVMYLMIRVTSNPKTQPL